MAGIYKKVNELMRRLGAVEKKHSVQDGPARYSYRSYSDLFQAMQPLMVDIGLVHETSFRESTVGLAEMHSKNGPRTGTAACGVFIVTMIDIEDGSRMSWEAPVVSMDTSDKAGGKAASYGIKTALFTGLQIPIEEEEDHDARRPEAASNEDTLLRSFVAQAAKATSVEELRSINEKGKALGLQSQEKLSKFLREVKQMLEKASPLAPKQMLEKS